VIIALIFIDSLSCYRIISGIENNHNIVLNIYNHFASVQH